MMSATTNRTLGVVVTAITAGIIIFLLATGIGWGTIGGKIDTANADVNQAVQELTVTKVTPEQLERLSTEKYENISQVLLESSLTSHDKPRTEATGFSDALTYGFKAKDDAGKFAELQEEILRNPVYGVTVAKAIKDKKIGDHRIGDFNSWMDEMVTLHEKNGTSYWCEYRGGDQSTIYVTDEYRIYAATLCTWLERLLNQGVHAWQTVENWPLNSAAMNNDRVGVQASYQYTKDALILSYVGKNQVGNGAEGETAAVGSGLFVIGFNIHDKRPEFYGGTPENPTPYNPPSVPPYTPPSDPPYTPPSDPPYTPPSDPPDDPGYVKDPSKAPKENTEPNDNSGPGTSTNSGGNQSTKDQPTNSNHMTYDDYKDTTKELKETNETQKTGSDPSTPSTPKPSSGAKVDNNGDSGTPTSEPINNPTPVTPPATDAKTGEPIDSTPGEAWGGPSD